MRMRTGARSVRGFFRLTAAVLLVLGGANAAWPQGQLPPPQSPPAATLGPPTFPVDPPSSSQVFPEGGFPTSPAAPEGGIPAPTARPGPGPVYPRPRPPAAEYAPPGLEAREVQEAPGVPEFYRPVSDPLPAYYYRPSYYDTPGIGARPLADYAPPGY